MYSSLIDDIAKKQKENVLFSVGDGVRVFLAKERNQKKCIYNADTLRNVERWKPKLLFLVDRWNGYEPDALKNQLKKLLGDIGELQTHVVFVAQVPICEYGARQNFRKIVNYLSSDGKTLPKVLPSAKNRNLPEILSIVEEIARKNPRLSVLRPDKLFFNPDSSVRYAEGRKFYYIDDNHLSLAGAELARPLFEEAIRLYVPESP
jgi:hypothetical protein